MLEPEALSIAIVGGGYMGLHHLKRIREIIDLKLLENVSVGAVCDTDLDTCKIIHNKYGLKTSTDVEELICNENYNAIIIATPTKFHKEQVELCIRENKSFYLEKPIGISIEECEEITESVAASGLNHQVGLCFRFSPNVYFIKKLIAGSQFGRPLYCNYREDSSFPSAGIYRTNWRANKELTGGGILHEENVHDFDLLQYLFGDFRLNSVKFDKFDRTLNIETYFEGVFEFDSGLRTCFQSIWHPFKGRGSTRRIEIFFEKGMISSDFFFEGNLSYRLNEESPVELSGKELSEIYFEDHGLELEYHHIYQKYGLLPILSFLTNLQNGKNCEPALAAAIKTERKVFESYRTGEWFRTH